MGTRYVYFSVKIISLDCFLTNDPVVKLHAIAASHSGRYIATSCRATSPEHAGIKLYDTTSWQQFGKTLIGHQLTITRIAFSNDDKYILSVSRDRTWHLFEASDGTSLLPASLNEIIN